MELFISVCDDFKVLEETSRSWLDKIKRQYSEETRHFHNLNMLERKLKLIEEVATGESFKNALIVASIFQNYNYDVKRDLKSENCDEFRLFIDQAGIKDERFVTDVLAMLQDEATQAPEDSSYQIDLFNDLALAVLGSPPDDYANYSQRLKLEYKCTESYNKDRLKMLKTLLMIPFIYSNEKIRGRFEAVARENIQKEIEDLQN